MRTTTPGRSAVRVAMMAAALGLVSIATPPRGQAGTEVAAAGEEAPPVEHARRTFAADALACAACHEVEESGAAGRLLRLDPRAPGAGRERAPYASAKMRGSFVALSPATIACLGCHDGRSRPEAARGAPDIVRSHGLRASHPVGYRYDATLAARRPGLVNPDATASGLGGTVARDLLQEGTVQCTSCHRFHEGATRRSFALVRDYQGLCTACHKME